MCIAIYLPKGQTLTKKELLACAKYNRDGFGYAYIDKKTKKIKYKKTVFRENNTLEKELLQEWDTIKKDIEENESILHFRLATHGYICNRMSHPFVLGKSKQDEGVTEDSVLIHNGVMQGRGTQEVSDTYDFCTTFFAKNKNIEKTVIEKIIGTNNKMIKLDIATGATIYNEQQGVRDTGRRFSNYNYIPTPAKQKNKKYTYTEKPFYFPKYY